MKCPLGLRSRPAYRASIMPCGPARPVCNNILAASGNPSSQPGQLFRAWSLPIVIRRLAQTASSSVTAQWILPSSGPVRDSSLIKQKTCRQDTRGGQHPEGISLLEMMPVVTLILILGGTYVRVPGKAWLIL
jgi:hypothetical protein